MKSIGIVGLAILTAVCVAGCSAEQGGFGEESASGENIGESTEALTVLPSALKLSASCVINDGGVDKMIVFGGFNSLGNAVSGAWIFDPTANSGNGAWTATGTNMATARGAAKAIAIPGTDKCIVMGGATTDAFTSTIGTSETYDLSDDSFAAAVNMSAERIKFEVSTCEAGKIIAVGGENDSTSALNTIDVYNPGTNSWATIGATIGARRNLGLAGIDRTSDGELDAFLIAGGFNGSTWLNSVQVLTVDSSCATPTVTSPALTGGGTRNTLSVGRELLAAFPSGASNQFLVAAGRTGQYSVTDAVDVVTFTFASPPTVNITTGTPLSTERARPALAKFGSKYVLAAGESDTGGPVDDVQMWNPATPGWDTETLLPAGENRHSAALEYLPSASKAVLVGGVGVSGVTDLATAVP